MADTANEQVRSSANGEHASRAGSARQRLIRAGEHFFARHGFDQVSVQDITKRAGQRNASAIHYHFGSREGLLEAISTRHHKRTDAVRQAALDDLEFRDAVSDVRAIIAILALAPMTDMEEREDVRDWLRITPQVVHLTRTTDQQLLDYGPHVPALHKCLRYLRERVTHLPEDIFEERVSLVIYVITLAHAERAIQIESGTARIERSDFVQNLVEMLTAALFAPSPRPIVRRD
jgi:AcrR family transcriptional regulator